MLLPSGCDLLCVRSLIGLRLYTSIVNIARRLRCIVSTAELIFENDVTFHGCKVMILEGCQMYQRGYSDANLTQCDSGTPKQSMQH